MQRTATPFLLMLLMTGCDGDLVVKETERLEGTEAGDCSDGADNDADGLFDCNDDGCTGAPDCIDIPEPDADADADADADTDADADADADTDDTGAPPPADLDGDGFSVEAGDCDDENPTINPLAPELCDDIDNNCNGVVDESPVDPTAWYLDRDGDGFGDPAWPYTGCDPLPGYVADGTDCNDDSEVSNPSALEICDGIDNDCDTVIDEGETVIAYLDDDGDGFGFEPIALSECDSTDGTASEGADCDDGDAAVYPGAPDTPYDGVDSDCGGGSDYDVDGDGYDDPSGGGADCDDLTSTTYPGAFDVPYDGVDADCAGDDDHDDDADGYVPDDYLGMETAGVEGSGSLPGGDCDDTDPDRHPGMDEFADDGVDSDCDGEDDPSGLSGEWGSSWVTVASGPSHRGLQEYLDAGAEYMYVGNDRNFSRLHLDSEIWETLASPPGGLAYWGSAALGNDGGLWQIRTSQAYRYDPPSNSWTTKYGFSHSGDEQSMTVTDRDGNLWAYQGGSMMVRYNPSTEEIDIFDVAIPPSTYETRLGYNRPNHSIYFGGFSDDEVYRYDIETGVTDTTLTRHPEGFLNDIFCSDRNGHIYAAGSSSGTSIWQYDIATDTWTPITDYPTDHGNNGSCSVSLDGWLYMEPGSVTTLYKLPLY